jgi:dihydrofolate reductase
MHPIIYDVAVSIDGYISGPEGDVSAFPHEGTVVEDYATRLSQYSTCLMGRKTYEFGYAFGLTPGDNPYPHMRSIVISSTIELPDGSQVEQMANPNAETIRAIQEDANGPIYLCGGGVLAGWAISNELVSYIRLKRAPIILGSGVKLFDGVTHLPELKELEMKAHDGGIIYQEFEIQY